MLCVNFPSFALISSKIGAIASEKEGRSDRRLTRKKSPPVLQSEREQGGSHYRRNPCRRSWERQALEGFSDGVGWEVLVTNLFSEKWCTSRSQAQIQPAEQIRGKHCPEKYKRKSFAAGKPLKCSGEADFVLFKYRWYTSSIY